MKNVFTIFFSAVALSIASIVPATAQWSTIGNGISGAVANYVSLATDANNNVICAYKDNSVGDKLSVRRYNGSSWSTVGSTGISGGSADYIDVAAYGTNIYVAYKDWNKSGRVSVKYYNGSSWSTVGWEGFSGGSVDFVSIAVSSTGIPVVAYQDNNKGGRVTAKGYYNGTWTTLESEGFTNVADYVDIAIDPSDNLYVAYRDNGNNYRARVEKFDINTNTFYTYGSSGISSGSCQDISLAVTPGGQVYIAYRDNANSGKLGVKKYNSGSWSSVGSSTGVSTSSVNTPSLALDGNETPYVAFKDDNAGQKATVLYYTGTTWSAVTTAGFSAGQIDYTSLAIDGNDNLYVGFKDNNASQKATIMKHGSLAPVNVWDGSSSTDWYTAANWSMNVVPTGSDNAKIPGSLSRYPNITSGTASCKDITINSGASVTVNGGTLQISGAITNSGTFTASNGTIVMNGSAAQTIPANCFVNNDVEKLVLNNSAGCTLNGTLDILEEFTPTAGKLTTNGYLILKSSSTRTGRIGTGSSSGNYIDGNVTVERYIPGGRRAFRFLSHPFSSAIALSQLTDDIDITGSGGSSNGFTTTGTNSASAFWFDVTTADNSTYGNNPGWKAFTSAYTATWDPYEMARILVRGTKGQGLTTTNYTPNAVTLDMSGTVNQGDKLVGLARGNNSLFAICGNPFPSPVNLRYVSRTNVYSTFYVWDANQGTKGGYVAYQFGSDYILPVGGAFVTKISSSTGYMNFQESDKSSSTPAGLFKTTAQNNYLVEVSLHDSTINWDRILINFDSSATAMYDTLDAEKMNNPEIDFFTISDDADSLSIDVRPYADSTTIKLGMLYAAEKDYVLKVPQFDIPYGTKLYLYDKFLNKTEEMKLGMEYWFQVTSDTNSQGMDRFSINLVGKPVDTTTKPIDTTTSIATTKVSTGNTTLQVAPNPAQDFVKVSFDKVEGKAMIRITNLNGSVVYLQEVNAKVGSVTVPIGNMPAGVYMVEMQTAKGTLVEKLVKQ